MGVPVPESTFGDSFPASSKEAIFLESGVNKINRLYGDPEADWVWGSPAGCHTNFRSSYLQFVGILFFFEAASLYPGILRVSFGFCVLELCFLAFSCRERELSARFLDRKIVH